MLAELAVIFAVNLLTLGYGQETVIIRDGGARANIYFRLPQIPTTQLYAVRFFHKPEPKEAYHLLLPNTLPDKYELATTDNLIPGLGCATTETSSYCYQCHPESSDSNSSDSRASTNMGCRFALVIKSVEAKDTGTYAMSLNDGDRNIHLPTTNLTVLFRPEIFFTFEEKRYDNGDTVPLQIGERNILTAHIVNYYPALTSNCYHEGDKVEGAYSSVHSFVQNTTTNLFTSINRLTIRPKSTLEFVNCTLNSKWFDIPYYVQLPKLDSGTSRISRICSFPMLILHSVLLVVSIRRICVV